MSRAAFLVGCAVLSLACQAKDPVQPIPVGPQNLPPQARLAINQTFVEGIEFPGFDTRGTADPEGEPLRYLWDFGDGSSSTDDRPAHAFPDDGIYTVTLIVTDPHNAADTAQAFMAITNLAPYINSVSLSVPPMPSAVPARAVMHVDIVEYGANDSPQLSINWGDGTISQDTIHSYTVPGIYSLSVTVTDKDGAAATNAIWDPIWVYDASQNQGNPPGYDVIDLGNLGGNRAMPSSLNNRGEIVGSSMTADSQRHAFVWKDGVMRDLGVQLIGSSGAQTINDAGWIGGALWDDRFYENSLVVWRNGSPTIFRTGGEDNHTTVIAVDDAGQVLMNIAGHEDGSSALWRNGELIRLGGFIAAGGYATAWDMNSRSQVVGTSAFQVTGPQAYAWHAFLWEDGAMKDLGDPGRPCIGETDPYDCGYSVALSINESGQIVGAAGAPGATIRAVLWEDGSRTPKDLGFGTGRSRAVAINNRGEIAGDTDEPGQGYFQSADGMVVPLGSLGGGGTQVTAMNAGGVVVGSSKTATGEVHPFVWRRETGMVDLGAGAYGARGIGAFPVAINDRGDVAGYVVPCLSIQYGGCHTGGPTRGILWRATTPGSVATARRSR